MDLKELIMFKKITTEKINIWGYYKIPYIEKLLIWFG